MTHDKQVIARQAACLFDLNPMFYIAHGVIFAHNMSMVERKIGEIIQTLRLTKKTSREDYTQHLRLVGLGLGAVGGIAFIIKLVSEFVSLGLGGR